MTQKTTRFRSEYELEALKIPPFYRKYCTDQAVDYFHCDWKGSHNFRGCPEEKAVLDSCVQILALRHKNINLQLMYLNDPDRFIKQKVAPNIHQIRNPLNLLYSMSGYNLH